MSPEYWKDILAEQNRILSEKAKAEAEEVARRAAEDKKIQDVLRLEEEQRKILLRQEKLQNTRLEIKDERILFWQKSLTETFQGIRENSPEINKAHLSEVFIYKKGSSLYKEFDCPEEVWERLRWYDQVNFDHSDFDHTENNPHGSHDCVVLRWGDKFDLTDRERNFLKKHGLASFFSYFQSYPKSIILNDYSCIYSHVSDDRQVYINNEYLSSLEEFTIDPGNACPLIAKALVNPLKFRSTLLRNSNYAFFKDGSPLARWQEEHERSIRRHTPTNIDTPSDTSQNSGSY